MPFDIGPINEPPQTVVNLRQLADYLERIPDWRYRQKSFETCVMGVPVAWCAFGHAARSGLFGFQFNRRDNAFSAEGRPQCVDQLAKRVFGLNCDQAFHVFGGYLTGGRKVAMKLLRAYADDQEQRARQPIAA